MIGFQKSAGDGGKILVFSGGSMHATGRKTMGSI